MGVGLDEPELVAELGDEFPFQASIEGAEHRGITLAQLKRVLQYVSSACKKWNASDGEPSNLSNLTLSQLLEWMVRPATKEKNCSFVELLAGEKQEPEWFVSAWQGSTLVDLVRCIELHVATRGLKDDTPFWIDAFAQRQHCLAEEMSGDPRETSLCRALQNCAAGVLLVLDSSARVTLQPWSVFALSRVLRTSDSSESPAGPSLLDVVTCTELLDERAARLLTDGLTEEERHMEEGAAPGQGRRAKAEREAAFPLEVAEACLAFRCEKALVSDAKDGRRVLNAIANTAFGGNDQAPPEGHQNYGDLDKRVRGIFAVAMWPQAVMRGKVQELSLDRVLAEDAHRKKLAMCLGHCWMIGNLEAAAIARAFPSSLQAIDLSFERCEKLGNVGVASLAQSLPSGLQSLRLHLGGCEEVDDEGLAALARKFPNQLEALDVNFDRCEKIEDGGVAFLVRNLPGSLKELSLCFSSCRSIGNAGIAAIGRHLPTGLTRLRLCFTNCAAIGNAGVAGLVANLPSSLEALSLDFTFCKLLSDGGIAAVAACLSSCVLKSLDVYLSCCGRIGDEGVAALAGKLPKTLKQLGLHFTNCPRIGDAGSAALALGLPDSLETAKLCFQHTGISAERQETMKSLESLRAWKPSADEAAKPATPAGSGATADDGGDTAVTPALTRTPSPPGTPPCGMLTRTLTEAIGDAAHFQVPSSPSPDADSAGFFQPNDGETEADALRRQVTSLRSENNVLRNENSSLRGNIDTVMGILAGAVQPQSNGPAGSPLKAIRSQKA